MSPFASLGILRRECCGNLLLESGMSVLRIEYLNQCNDLNITNEIDDDMVAL